VTLPALTALTVAALQIGRLPGIVWLVIVLAATATIMELGLLLRERQFHRAPTAARLLRRSAHAAGGGRGRPSLRSG
jgi:hypothetical protein